MSFIFRPALVCPLLFLPLAACSPEPPATLKVEELYKLHCAACHGVEFEGGVGGSLVDGKWNHGGDDKAIYDSISNGNAAMGMTPFQSTLEPEQIRAVVIFLREKEKEERYRVTNFPKPDPGSIVHTESESYKMEIVTKNLQSPWAVAFLPDGRFLVTEKAGSLRIVDSDGAAGLPVKGTPKVVVHGQGGLMDVAAHPDFTKNGWIYLAFADGEKSGDKAKVLTAIVRGRIKDNRWTDQEWIWRGDEQFYGGAGVHFGSRIVFRDGYVFFIIGERGGMMEVQDLKRPNGKIFRLHDDGRIPSDNPFVGESGAEAGIWSYGHRNPQGLAFDGRNGDLYSTEHGPRGGDEFNLILKGRNYGWPVITYGMNYNGTPFTNITEKEGMEQPLIHWTPSIAACGLAFYNGDRFPAWKNDFFAGGLRSQELLRLRVIDHRVVEQEIVLKNAGRVRDVKCGPDGYLYLILNDPDNLVRLVPVP